MSFPIHIDAIAAPSDVLDVQRLVDVADEVNDKLGSLVPPPRPQLRIEQLLGVVLKGAHDAAVLLAVALEVDAAILRRAILRVDEVEVLAEAAPLGVPDAVGPGRDAGEVVLRVVAQQRLEVRRRLLPDEVAGDVGDGDVAQTCARSFAAVSKQGKKKKKNPRVCEISLCYVLGIGKVVLAACTYCPRL